MKQDSSKWLPRSFTLFLERAKNKFSGHALDPVNNPYGSGERWWKQGVSDFDNRGEQVMFFATSGSSGFMNNGVYSDISGAGISAIEFFETMRQAGLDEMLEPGSPDKIRNGEWEPK